MTQEEKQLLLKDLCARLPYGVKINVPRHYEDEDGTITLDAFWLYDIQHGRKEIKPYLRPMSSMTEKERRQFSIFIGKTEVYVQQIRLDADSMANPIIGGNKCVYWGLFDRCIDWLNKNMFDYRDLIPMGLALEAKEEMYKTE